MRAAEFVDSYISAWNHRDAKLVAGHLANDGKYCDVPRNQEHSRAELLEQLDSFFESHEHRYELLGEILKGENTIAFQYRVSSPGAGADAFYGAEFITLAGTEAVRIFDYYDVPGASVSQEQKYTKSGLSPAQMDKYKRRLESLMQYEKVYRRPDLTLPKLAGLLNCSVNHVSQVINSGFGMSFFDYLSQYRIEHAKRMLSRPDGLHQSVLSIAFTVGFNSNSSFYSAFKKACGQTPAQYRKSHVMSEGK